MSTLELLSRKLESQDAEERREAAVDLGRAERGAIPLLLRALGDPDWRVRKTAVEGLIAFGGDDVTNGLVQRLSAEDNAGARNSAIEALSQIGAAAVDPLLPLLDSEDPDVRKFAVDVLGDIRDVRAVPGLLEKLNDADENVRVAAAESLGKLRDRRAVDALIGCLSSRDQGWLDYAAAEALGEIGDERALQPLIAALGRSSLREPVLEALGKIGNVNTLPPLISGLADPLRIVREASVAALVTVFRKSVPADRGKIVAAVRDGIADRTMPFLEELIDTCGGEQQKSAVVVLGWTGRPAAVPKLLSLLRDEEMVEPVVHALRNLGQECVPLLLGRLGDDNVLARRAVAVVLGEFGRREAEDALLSMLDDENGHVRGAAAESLGRLTSRRAVVPLLKLLEDEYENVQECAIRALADIGDESVLDGLLTDFTLRDAGMRRNIVRLLGRFGTERVFEALSFALKDEEADVRKAVVIALDTIRDSRAIRPLLLAITDDDPEVRMLAAETLGRTGSAESAEALIPLLDDEDLWVRAAAARALGKVGADRFGAVLAGHLKEASDIFLLALVDVVGRVSVREALEPLLSLTSHEDPEVRKTVLGALSSYDWVSVRPSVLSHLFDPHWSVRKSAAEILKNRRDPATDLLLEQMAADDPDPTVRQAAKEALGR
jgi:HEAT repeat protein